MPPVAKKRAPKKTAPAKKATKVAPAETDELDDLDVVEEGGGKTTLLAIYDVEKQTPGTYRYKERYDEGELPINGTIYMKKTAVRELDEPGVLSIVFFAGEVTEQQWEQIQNILDA